MSIIPPPARHLLPLTTATIDFPSKPSSRSFHSSTAPIAGADLSVFSLGCFNPSHFCAAWPRRKRLSSSQQTWLRGIMRRDQDVKNSDFGEESEMQMLSSEDDAGTEILIQAQSLMEGYGPVLASEYKPVPEVDYLQTTEPVRCCSRSLKGMDLPQKRKASTAEAEAEAVSTAEAGLVENSKSWGRR